MSRLLCNYASRGLNGFLTGVVSFLLSCGPGKDPGKGRGILDKSSSRVDDFKDQIRESSEVDRSFLTGPSGLDNGRARNVTTPFHHAARRGYGCTHPEMKLRALGHSLDGPRDRNIRVDQSSDVAGGSPLGASIRASTEATSLTPGQRVVRIRNAFNEAMLACPGRVWPDYRWDSYEVYLTDATTQKAWLWKKSSKSKTGSATALPYASVPTELTFGWFSFPSVPTPVPQMGLSLSNSASFNDFLYGSLKKGDYLADLGMHEAFHGFFQTRADWRNVADSEDASRSTEFPMRYEPRYLRYMIADKMIAYLQSNPRDRKLLQQAKFFLNMYNKEFMKEAKAIAGTDQAEGSAEYVEEVGSIIAQLGCNVSEANLIKKMTEKAVAQHWIQTAADMESYHLGHLAGSILRSHPQYKGWELKVQQGRTLLDTLLGRMQPVSSPDDESIKSQVKSRINEENERMAKKLEPFLKILKNANAIRIFIPYTLMAGAFGADAFIRLSENGYELAVNQEASYISIGKSIANITVSNYTTVDGHSFPNLPCTSNGYQDYGSVALVDPMSIPKPVSQRLNVDLKSQVDADRIMSLKIDDAPVEIKRDSQNKIWYCLK